jgi:hypothetical protein
MVPALQERYHMSSTKALGAAGPAQAGHEGRKGLKARLHAETANCL